jgi:hypothetical protein
LPAIKILDRIKNGWNAFLDRDPTQVQSYEIGPSYSRRPDRNQARMSTERSIVSGIYNRISIDVSSVLMHHVRLDQNDRYIETLPTGLDKCLSLDANIDQTGRAFMQDVVLSLFDEGSVAIVPVDTTVNPAESSSWDVQSIRTGKITQWYPAHVSVFLYNDHTGQKEDVILPKKDIAIIENPLYSVMNEPNSTVKRLIRTLDHLDAIDTQSASGKLDLLIQLPYVIKTQARQDQAEQRRKDIESQLMGSKYGIAYIDGTEKVTQLNRPAENNLMVQVQFLTSMLYSQLGITEAIFDGTANEEAIINYYNRTVNPILSAIADELKRKYLTQTAITQGQSIMYFRNPFGLVPVSQIGTIADSLTRNAVASSNDIRVVLGWRPSSDPEADKLSNKNLNQPAASPSPAVPTNPAAIDATTISKGAINNGTN